MNNRENLKTDQLRTMRTEADVKLDELRKEIRETKTHLERKEAALRFWEGRLKIIQSAIRARAWEEIRKLRWETRSK